MMWKAAIIFVVVFIFSVSVVHNLYQSLEIKELKEKLSWYTQRMDPVPVVLVNQEGPADEEG